MDDRLLCPTPDEVLEFLRKPCNAGKRMDAKEIAKGMGYNGRRNTNPILSDLEKQGLVASSGDRKVEKPVWWLVLHPGHVSSETSSESEILYTKTDTRDGKLIFTPNSSPVNCESEILLYTKTDAGDGRLIFTPTTVEELTTEHPTSQPSTNGPTQHTSATDDPGNVLQEPKQEKQEPSNSITSPRNPDILAAVLPNLTDSKSESRPSPSGVDEVATLSKEMRDVSLQGCPDTQREDESTPSEQAHQ